MRAHVLGDRPQVICDIFLACRKLRSVRHAGPVTQQHRPALIGNIHAPWGEHRHVLPLQHLCACLFAALEHRHFDPPQNSSQRELDADGSAANDSQTLAGKATATADVTTDFLLHVQ